MKRRLTAEGAEAAPMQAADFNVYGGVFYFV
jgi:hypothetical protein